MIKAYNKFKFSLNISKSIKIHTLMYKFIHEVLFIIFKRKKSYLKSQFNESTAAILCMFKNARWQLEYFV